MIISSYTRQTRTMDDNKSTHVMKYIQAQQLRLLLLLFSQQHHLLLHQSNFLTKILSRAQTIKMIGIQIKTYIGWITEGVMDKNRSWNSIIINFFILTYTLVVIIIIIITNSKSKDKDNNTVKIIHNNACYTLHMIKKM